MTNRVTIGLDKREWAAFEAVAAAEGGVSGEDYIRRIIGARNMIGYEWDDGGAGDRAAEDTDAGDLYRAVAILTGRPYEECREEASAFMAALGGRPAGRSEALLLQEFGLVKVRWVGRWKPAFSKAHEEHGDCIVRDPLRWFCIRDGNLRDVEDLRWARNSGRGGGRSERRAMAVWVRAVDALGPGNDGLDAQAAVEAACALPWVVRIEGEAGKRRRKVEGDNTLGELKLRNLMLSDTEWASLRGMARQAVLSPARYVVREIVRHRREGAMIEATGTMKRSHAVWVGDDEWAAFRELARRRGMTASRYMGVELAKRGPDVHVLRRRGAQWDRENGKWRCVFLSDDEWAAFGRAAPREVGTGRHIGRQVTWEVEREADGILAGGSCEDRRRVRGIVLTDDEWDLLSGLAGAAGVSPARYVAREIVGDGG